VGEPATINGAKSMLEQALAEVRPVSISQPVIGENVLIGLRAKISSHRA